MNVCLICALMKIIRILNSDVSSSLRVVVTAMIMIKQSKVMRPK
jgi:hypothetical protein